MAQSALQSPWHVSSDSLSTSPAETRRIRLAISEHLGGLCAGEVIKPSSIPHHVQGVHRQYVAAVRANLASKSRLFMMQNREIDPLSTSSSTSEETFSEHLNLVKIRKRYAQLHILSDHASSLEKTREDHEAKDAPETMNVPTVTIDQSHFEASRLIAESRELTRELEDSLLTINDHLQKERKRIKILQFEELHAMRLDTDSKLRALTAVRAELTDWVENSLAKCDTSQTSLSADVLDPQDTSTTIDIDYQYECYIETRRKLVLLLSHNLPLAIVQNEGAEFATRQPQQTLHRKSNLLQLESRLLHMLSTSSDMKSYKTHLNDSISDVLRQSDIDLSRLQDESHLLLSYPLLAQPPTRQSTSAMVGDTELVQLGHLQRRLNCWTFADNAATLSVTGTINKQLSESKKAAQGIDGALTAIEMQNNGWEYLKVIRNQKLAR